MASKKQNIFEIYLLLNLFFIYILFEKVTDQVEVLNIEQTVYFLNRYLSTFKNQLLNIRKPRLYQLWWEFLCHENLYAFYYRFDNWEDKP